MDLKLRKKVVMFFFFFLTIYKIFALARFVAQLGLLNVCVHLFSDLYGENNNNQCYWAL